MPTLHDIFGDDVNDTGADLAAALVASDHSLLTGLVALRKSKNLTQNDVAVACGISQPSVAAFERYDSDPKLSTIRRYAHAIGANVEHAVIDHDKLEPERLQWSFGTSHVFYKLTAPADRSTVGPKYVQASFARAL